MQVATGMGHAVVFFAALSTGGFFGGLPVAHGTEPSPSGCNIGATFKVINPNPGPGGVPATIPQKCCGGPQVVEYNTIYQRLREEEDQNRRTGGDSVLSITQQMEKTHDLPKGGSFNASSGKEVDADGNDGCRCICELDSFDDADRDKLEHKLQTAQLTAHIERSVNRNRGMDNHQELKMADQHLAPELGDIWKEGNPEDEENMQMALMTTADWDNFYRHHMDHNFNKTEWDDFDHATKASLTEDEQERMRVLLTKKRRQMANMPRHFIANKGSMLYWLANKGFEVGDDGKPTDKLKVPPGVSSEWSNNLPDDSNLATAIKDCLGKDPDPAVQQFKAADGNLYTKTQIDAWKSEDRKKLFPIKVKQEWSKEKDNPILALSKQWYRAAAKVWRKVAPIDRGGDNKGRKEYNGTEAPTPATWEAMKKNYIAETATDWMNKVQEFKILATKFRESAEGIYNEIVRAHNVLTAMQVNTLPTELEAMERPKSQYHEQAGFANAINSALGDGDAGKAHAALQATAEAIAEHAFQHEDYRVIKLFSQNDYVWENAGELLTKVRDITNWGDLGIPTDGYPVQAYQVELISNSPGFNMDDLVNYVKDPTHRKKEKLLAKLKALREDKMKEHGSDREVGASNLATKHTTID